MRYGLPYKGSKNKIAEQVIDILPRSDTFVDLFFGGGAITHCGMLSGKWKQFIVNDIDVRLPQLFVDCINGNITVDNHTEWVSRQDFMERKDKDVLLSLVWSFGNNRVDYIYGSDIEELKHEYHNAVYFDDIDALLPFGYKLSLSKKNSPYERYIDYKSQMTVINREKSRCENKVLELESLERLNRLESLERLKALEIESLEWMNRLKVLGFDYQDVEIPNGAVIYCDPPYNNSNCGSYNGFDNDRFHKWAREQDNIYISEYDMPSDFVCIAKIRKQVLSSSKGNSDFATEKIYTNQRTYENMDEEQRRKAMINTAEQMSIFDFGG